MTECCDEVCFTELVKCYTENGYKKAWGWTVSTGQTGSYPYTPPSPYEYDHDYEDETDTRLGTHGGCPSCIMTLIHLRKLYEKGNGDNDAKPDLTVPIIIAVASIISVIAIIYILKRGK